MIRIKALGGASAQDDAGGRRSLMRQMGITTLALLAALTQPGLAQDVAAGQAVFAEACATCHGPEAKGDGPMAQVLVMPVPDLTGLAARNGGTFPWLTVVHLVDGRSGLRGHGGPMPIFGALFKGDTAAADAPDGTPVITSARVLDVVAYLETIQN